MARAFNVTGFWSMVGVMLLLVAIYLVLMHATGATSVLSSLFTGGGGVLAVLQGRTASAA